MKKTLFLLLFLNYYLGFGQGNLQFNQILNLTFTAGGNNYSVPVGRVWKIENIGQSSYSSYFTLGIAGQNIFLKNTHTGYTSEFNSLPFWINGGQTVTFSGLNSGVVSVLEFNVIP